MVIEEVAAEGGLGSLGAEDAVGGGAELFFPFGVGFDNAGRFDDGTGLAIGADDADIHCSCVAGRIGLIGHGRCDVGFAADEEKQKECGQEKSHERGVFPKHYRECQLVPEGEG